MGLHAEANHIPVPRAYDRRPPDNAMQPDPGSKLRARRLESRPLGGTHVSARRAPAGSTKLNSALLLPKSSKFTHGPSAGISGTV